MKLTESTLRKIVRKMINEQQTLHIDNLDNYMTSQGVNLAQPTVVPSLIADIQLIRWCDLDFSENCESFDFSLNLGQATEQELNLAFKDVVKKCLLLTNKSILKNLGALKNLRAKKNVRWELEQFFANASPGLTAQELASNILMDEELCGILLFSPALVECYYENESQLTREQLASLKDKIKKAKKFLETALDADLALDGDYPVGTVKPYMKTQVTEMLAQAITKLGLMPINAY
jgi:hypothetical protein